MWLRGVVWLSVGAMMACTVELPGGGDGKAPTGGHGAHGMEGGSGGDSPNGQDPQSDVPEDPYAAPPQVPSLDTSVVDALSAELDALFDGVPAASQSVLVVGADTGQVIYARVPDWALKPASTTKLLTTALAFTELGEDHRMQTRLVATTAPVDGVLDGDLVLFSEHEIDWTTFLYADARFAIDTLVSELDGVEHITGKVEVRGEVLFEPYKFGDYDPEEHRVDVLLELNDALAAAGITHGGLRTSASFVAPAGVELATWTSSALPVSVSPINRISHNEQADALVRHLGYRMYGTSSTAMGNDGMRDLLAGWADPTGVALFDGSGLSHANRLSARHLVAIVEGMRREPTGLAWERTMSIGGVRGSFEQVFDSADTYGRVRAKNGRLTGVITMAGFLDHVHDGQRYVFAMLANGLADEQAAVNANIWAVEALADDHRQLGPRPSAPVLRACTAGEDPRAVTVSWTAVSGADGYLVWRSEDGKTWDREQARYVHATSHTTHSFAANAALFVRVTAVGAAGESEASDVYAAQPGAGPRVLVIDGNDRWQAEPQPENPSALGHDFAAVIAHAVAPLAMDTCDNDAVIAGTCSLTDYAAVVWSLGEESTDHETFDSTEQALVTSFLDGGGKLVVSGAELGWDLAAKGTAADTAFLENVLGIGYAGDASATWWVAGMSDRLAFYTPDRMVADYADQLVPLNGTAWLHYEGGDGGVAAVVSESVAVVGFPIESIDNHPQRAALLGELLESLGL